MRSNDPRQNRSRSKSRCLYLVGNPVIANDNLAIDARGAFYFPFGVSLVEVTSGSALMIYDRPSSFLAALGRPELNQIGQMLDGKIDDLAAFLAAA